ncbi:MAG TPA: LPS export ABC transporter ATP-binding protein [Gemmatimonadaceae bacterium]|nr:LPS export ABC transporter ATP-binding protein [Gemmatimonadaceae bacterium]
MTAGLRASELRWHRARRWIVDGVSIAVAPGEIVGLLGPNGAGKTVTLSMIAGLLAPTSGRVFIDDVDVTELPLYRRARAGLGYLPQERSIFTKLSARDNILAILGARGVRRRDAGKRADELLEQFGLGPLARTRAAQLSGGEQRRLEVARCLAVQPRILLFDEPFAGIDPLTIESLHHIMVRLGGAGVGVLVTDHNVRETLALCDRAYVLFDGRVLAEGTPAVLVGNTSVREHFLGESFDARRGVLLGDRDAAYLAATTGEQAAVEAADAEHESEVVPAPGVGHAIDANVV